MLRFPHFALRPLGGALLALAYGIGRHLMRIGPEHAHHEPLGIYLLSAALFACASTGAALLFHGRHLFDQIVVSKRWIVAPPPSMADLQAAGERPENED